MKALLEKIQEKLSEVEGLKYIDENWGQLDYYSPNMPVQYPCVLIDIGQVQYSNLGKDLTKRPVQRQIGSVQLRLTIANMRLTNTSGTERRSVGDMDTHRADTPKTTWVCTSSQCKSPYPCFPTANPTR